MKVTCPSCGHASQVDAAKIPEKGVQTKCRKCDARFLLDQKGARAVPLAKKTSEKGKISSPASPKSRKQTPPDSSEPEVYVCEKCKHKQHPARACVYCGNPFPQYKPPALESQPQGSKKQPEKPKSLDKKEPERINPKPALFPVTAGEGAGDQPGMVHCPFCDEQIREKAVKCKHCGEFLEGGERVAAGPPIRPAAVLSGLIDLRFTRMITPELVKAIYIAALGLGGIGTLIAVFFAVKGSAYLTAGGFLIGYLLLVLFCRVYAELSIIVFKIEENIRRVRR